MEFKPKSEDTRNFVKLKDKESIVGVFRGKFYEYRTHWADGRSTICPGKEQCDLCKAGNKSKFRFRVNFVVKEGDGYGARVLDQTWTVYETLRALQEDYHPLEKYIVKITRHGSGLQDTSYTVIPVPNALIDHEKEKKIDAVALNNLSHITEAETEPPASPPPYGDEDIPF